MEERTRGALALMPAGNLEGSWYYMILTTWMPVKRNWAKELPMPDVVIEYINKKASEESEKKNRADVNDSGRIGLWREGKVKDIEDYEYAEDEEDVAQEEIAEIELFEPREAEIEVNIGS